METPLLTKVTVTSIRKHCVKTRSSKKISFCVKFAVFFTLASVIKRPF